MKTDWTRIDQASDGKGDFLVRIAPPFHDGDGILLATGWEDRERTERYASRVADFMDAMVATLRREDLPRGYVPTLTTVYMDRVHYVRLSPGFVDLEATGYPHGISVAGTFETKPQALEYATTVEDEVAGIAQSLAATLPKADPFRTRLERLAKAVRRAVERRKIA